MEFPDYSIFTLIGNIGVVGLIFFYFMGVTGRMQATSLKYCVGNLLVGICLQVSLWEAPNMNNFIINIFWSVIAIWGIVSHYRSK